MTTAILGEIAKSVASEFENLRAAEITSKIIDGLEFVFLMTLPFFLPIIIMFLASLGY